MHIIIIFILCIYVYSILLTGMDGGFPVFRRFFAPKVHCSEGSLIRRFVGPKSKPIRVLHAYLLSILHFERSPQSKHLCFKPSVTLHRQVKRIEPAHVSFCRAHIDMYQKSSDFIATKQSQLHCALIDSD